jgi:hypothetical protein
MIFSLVMVLIVEHFVCSTWKLTKSWRLARLPSTRQPRSSLVFDCARDDELGEEIFQEEDHEHGDDEDGGVHLRMSMCLLL